MADEISGEAQFQFAGYYAAHALGYYQDAGLEVDIQPVRHDVDPSEAVISGQAEFGIASTDLLLMRSQGKPVVVLASVFQHSPYVLLAMRRNGIETVHDLVGKTVWTDPFATEILAYLKAMKVPAERIHLTEANNYTFEALVNGSADAYAGYLTNDPYYLDQAKADYLTFSPRAAGIDFYGDNLFTTEDQLRRFPERVAAFRQASLKGWDFAVKHPDKVIDLMIAHGWAKADERDKLVFEAEKTIHLIHPELVEIGYMSKSRWQHVLDTYADLGMLPRDMSLDGFLYGRQTSILPAWVIWALSIFSAIAVIAASFAAFAQRAKQRLKLQIAQREHAERAELKLAEAVYQSLGDALLLTDKENRIVSANPAFTNMSGYHVSELIGRYPTMMLPKNHNHHDFLHQLTQGLKEVGRWSGTVEVLAKNGAVVPHHLFMRVIPDEDGVPMRHICIFSSLDQDKSKDDTIWNSLHLDALTGLPNRKLLLHTLQGLIDPQTAGARPPITVMMLDIDHFQQINEVLGHNIGDQVLIETARRLRDCLGDLAYLARFDGDEFAIVLTQPEHLANVENIAQNLLAAMAEPFALYSPPFHLSASIGIIQFPKDSEYAERLIELGEQAMFVAKDSGRNRRVYFSPAMQEAALERARLTNDLRAALSARELSLEYQPIVCLRTGVVEKAEALLRWRHPVEGLICPAKFIRLAERSGLIVSIGQWSFREACRQLAVWRQHHNLQLSINKSPLEFQRENDDTMDLEYLHSLGLPGRAVVIEITEGLLLDTSSTVSDKLAALRSAGVQLSLDDFGTGYSSMAYLQKIDIDFIKIDQAFVKNLESNAGNRTLCHAIVMMAHGLGMRVIAEGVETQEQARILTELGCDFGQGFYFSKPLTPAKFEALLSVCFPVQPLNSLLSGSFPLER